MEDTANPDGSESNPSPENTIEAFEGYLKRQANQSSDNGEQEQSAQGAGNGQPDSDTKQVPHDATDDEQRFRVKINGEEREVPLSELLKGYSMESDYRVKTSQVAEQARAAHAQAQQATLERQQYAQALQAYQQQLIGLQPQPPDPAMIDADPVGYLRQQQAYSTWQSQMQNAQWESHQITQREQQQRDATMQAYISGERNKLLEAIPDWKDAEKAKAGKTELTKFLQSSGYLPEEISQAVDHRAVVLARKAMLYDQMMAKQTSANTKVSGLPPKPPQRPGSGESSSPDGRTRAMQNLKKSGSIEDAAQAFVAMMGR